MTVNQVVVFELNGVLYGIDILRVQEIMRMVEITPLAEAEMAVEGVINLRGEVIPVINLSRRLGMPEKGINGETRILVVDAKGKKTGLMVDRVLEVGSYARDEMEEPSNIGAHITFLKGIVKKENLWLVLDLEEVA